MGESVEGKKRGIDTAVSDHEIRDSSGIIPSCLIIILLTTNIDLDQ